MLQEKCRREMAAEIFGDVPLNVVVEDLRKLVERDIRMINRFIYGKYIICTLLLLHGIITKDLFATIKLLSWIYFSTYFFTCCEIKFGNRQKNAMSITLLNIQTLKYPTDFDYCVLLYRILVNVAYYIIEDYKEEERIGVLIDMSRKLFWIEQTSSLAPDFIRYG